MSAAAKSEGGATRAPSPLHPPHLVHGTWADVALSKGRPSPIAKMHLHLDDGAPAVVVWRRVGAGLSSVPDAVWLAALANLLHGVGVGPTKDGGYRAYFSHPAGLPAPEEIVRVLREHLIGKETWLLVTYHHVKGGPDVGRVYPSYFAMNQVEATAWTARSAAQQVIGAGGGS